MRCLEARSAIPLWVGGDVNPAEAEALMRHLRGCGACNELAQRMAAGLQALHEACTEAIEEQPSVWPRVARALEALDARRKSAGRFNGWVPALAVAACLLAMVSIVNHLNQNRDWDASPGRAADAISGNMGWINSPPLATGEEWDSWRSPRLVFPGSSAERERQRSHEHLQKVHVLPPAWTDSLEY